MLLLIQSATKDPEAQDFMLRLYQTYERLMYSIVKHCIPDAYAQEDVVQETILKLVGKYDLLRTLDTQGLSAYVSVATRNTAYSYLRKRSAEASIFLPWTADLERIPIQEPEIEEVLTLKDETQDFFRIWMELPDEDRFLLESKYILRQSDLELAKVLGCKSDSVRMKLTRVRRKVLKLIQNLEKGVKQT